MSERLPYEEMDRQFNDLPLPDEEASWQKMKELLDDDDDDIIPPPVFLRSCMGWGILLLIGLIVAWLVIRPEKRGSENDKTKNISSVKMKEKNIDKTNSVEKKNITSIPANQTGKQEIIALPKQKETHRFIESPLKRQQVEVTSIKIISQSGKDQRRKAQRKIFTDRDDLRNRQILLLKTR